MRIGLSGGAVMRHASLAGARDCLDTSSDRLIYGAREPAAGVNQPANTEPADSMQGPTKTVNALNRGSVHERNDGLCKSLHFFCLRTELQKQQIETGGL